MKEEELKVTPPPKTAAGRHAIEDALKQVFSKAGVVRGQPRFAASESKRRRRLSVVRVA